MGPWPNFFTGDPPPLLPPCQQPMYYSAIVPNYGPVLERIAAALERLAPAPAESEAAGNVEQHTQPATDSTQQA